MARKVKFNIGGNSLESEIVKVDRSKLYGSSKKVVRDIDGNECVLSSLYCLHKNNEGLYQCEKVFCLAYKIN